MRWLQALREVARSGLKVERARLEPLVAVRGAVGVVLVIGFSLWLVSPSFAVASAFGAFSAGAATFQRTWRPRAVIALGAGAALAISTLLGYLAASHHALFILLLLVWSFGAGLAWASGTTAGIIASTTVAIMLVTVTFPTSALGAVGHAAVIFLGGLVQAALIVLFPIRRWGAQRDALAGAFAAVADYARRLRDDPDAPFDPEPLMTARSAAAVTPRQARRRPAELHGSRVLAERIRPVLASLADPAVGAAAEGSERDRVRELLSAAASVLDAAARSIRNGEPARVPVEAVATLRARDAGVLTGLAKRSEARLIALLGEVLESAEGSGSSASVSFASADRSDTAPLLRPTMPDLLPVAARDLRSELRWDSRILRHAIRLSVVTSLGYLLGTLLPLGHGYWAPMTSVLVMRPDFHQTYSRVVGRLAGTLVGVGVATAVVRLLHPGASLSAALAIVFVFLMYLLMRTGYVVAQACVAAYVVFLLSMAGAALEQTALERVLLTLLGGVLAMVAYLLFPAWETPRILEPLANWLEANGRYAAAAIGGYAEPEERPRTREVREALLAARRERAAWEQILASAKMEPVRHPGLTRTTADDAHDAVAALARAAMLLEAHLPEREARPVTAAARFADALREATARGARDLREGRVPRWDEVEAALDAWEEPADGRERLVRRGAELVLDALEELTQVVGAFPLDRDEDRGR